MVSREEWAALVNSYMYRKYTPPGQEDEFWDAKIETMDRADLERIRNTKLRALVSYVYENSPFYHRKFDAANLKPSDFSSIKDISKGPITLTKEWSLNQSEKPPFGDLECISRDHWTRDGFTITTSGGTTTKPRVYMVCAEDIDPYTYTYARAYWSYGVRPGDIILTTNVYGPQLGLWGLHYAAHWLKIPVIPGGGMDTKKRILYIKDFEATTVVGVTSYILHMMEEAKQIGVDLATDTKINHVVLTAEPGACIPATKKRIEEAWSATTHDLFGHIDCYTGVLGYSCSKEDGHRDRPVGDHISEDMAVVEVVDPESLEPVAEGDRGLSIVTNLKSVSFPAFRFLMGDLIQYNSERCECGRTFGRAMGGLIGRVDDVMKIRGTTVYPSAIEDVIRSFSELGTEFEIVLTRTGELDEVLVRVEVDHSIPKSNWAVLTQRLSEELRLALGLRCEAELLEQGALPKFVRGDADGKARRLRDLRGK